MRSDYWKTIQEELERFAKDQRVIFIGQQCLSETFYGLLENISINKRRELPVMEECQLGMSIGLALEGFLPISIFQRCDFLPRCADQLINHLNLIPEMSRSLFKPKIIIFTTIGSTKPLDVGPQHNKNLIDGFRLLLPNIPILDLQTEKDVKDGFGTAGIIDSSIMLVVRQDLFEGIL